SSRRRISSGGRLGRSSHTVGGATPHFYVDKHSAIHVLSISKLISSAMTREEMIAEAERHVRQGESHIFSQQQVILNLVSCGATTALACELLGFFQDMQAVQVDHLKRLRHDHLPI